MEYRSKQVPILCILLLFLTALCAWSQTTVGTLNGVVRDPSAAVIPGAAVTLTKTDTGEIFKSTTTATGFYEFQGLVPGPYLVTVESKGMAKFEGKLIMIVGQVETVNATLQVQNVAQQITVHDVTPMVQTNNGTQMYTIDQQRIQQLPFNGRSIMNYLATVPGMEGTRSMGIEDFSYSFYLDGSDIASRFGWNEITAVGPGVDSIQEFAVEENAGSAKFARPVNFIATTKSGTNKIHGTAFEDILNNDLMYARTRTTFGSAPYLNRNEYGVSGGGPVYIPKLYDGRNKTFWFFAWEALKDDSPNIIGAPVPTQAWRQGNLAGDIDVNQVPYTIYDPYTTNPTTWARTPYNNNQITEAESPLAKFLMTYEAMPTLANVNPNIADNWYGPVVNWAKDYTLSTRVDQKIGDKDVFYGRYTRGMLNGEDQFYTLPTLDWSKVPSGTQGGPNPNWSLGLHWNHTFSPTFFNEVLASTSWVTFFDGTGNLGYNYDAELGLPNPFGAGGWPGIYSGGFPNVGPEGLSWETQNTTAAYESYIVVDDNATKVWRKHEFQFGAHFRADREDILPSQQQVAGSDDFSTMATGLYNPLAGNAYPLAVPYTGDHFANFYLGIGEYSNQLVPSSFNGRQKEWAAYIEDNWRITPRLTLNLGVRWEYYAPFSEAQGIQEGFDPTYGQGTITNQNVGNGVTLPLSEQGALVLASPLAQYYRLGFTNPGIISRSEQLGMNIESAAQAGYPSTLGTRNPLDFGPHLSFAYRLTEGAKPFVLRGGYSMSYFHTSLGSWAARMRMNTPTDVRYYYSLTWSPFEPAAANNIPDYGLISVPTNIAGQNTSNLVSTTNTNSIQPSSSFMDYWALNQPTPRVHTWNLTLEKELPGKMTLSAAYVGNHSFG
ncbi:MAG: TonB-dependent receptor, partial [Terracidiphilus sp.]